MSRVLCLLAAVLCWTVPPIVGLADDPAPASAEAEKIKSDPNDAKALEAYFNREFPKLIAEAQSDPEAAEKRLKGLREVIESLKPTDPQAQQWVDRASQAATSIGAHLETARLSLEEVEKRFQESPNDAEALDQYQRKVMQELGSAARADADKAAAMLDETRKTLDAASGKLLQTSERAVANFRRRLDQMEQTIAATRKLNSLVGQDAPPVTADAWVNGSPLTEKDFKGKVVLLDFWAVWCGPCIATFPHLRDWQDKYSEKGLVIVGLTNYHNYTWDDASGRATRAQGQVSPEQEHEMLAKFAEEHQLKHRFAVNKGNDLNKQYGVGGIPHAVVIDRQGKVRLIRVGSGEANAKALEAMIEECIAEGA